MILLWSGGTTMSYKISVNVTRQTVMKQITIYANITQYLEEMKELK